MPAYTDFAFRPNLSDPEGQTPSAPPITSCPDIWPAGTQPIANFQTVLASSSSWSSDPGQNIKQGFNNVIYARSKNFGGANNTGKVYIYYAPSAVISWPSQWAGNQLLTDQVNPANPNGPNLNYLTLNAAATGNIAVGNGAFLWTPAPPPPGSDHYCLFSQVVTAANPNPIPGANQPMTSEDMATIVANDLGIGWRNVSLIVQADQPTWSYSSNLSVPANSPAPVTVQVVLACNKMATGGAMAFNCSSLNGTSVPITLPKTPIQNANQVSGITTTLQPGFNGSITVYYWQEQAGQSPSGSNIAIQALTPATTPKMKALVNRRHMEHLKANALGIPIQEVVALGEMNYRMS
jgi:hypothetical protein